MNKLAKDVKRIEIKTRAIVESLYSGAYKSVFKGRGIEFAGIRPYYRGDEFRSIDWKVSARTGDLHVKEHMEERELQVVLAVDLSASMLFGTGPKSKRETAVELAALIALAANNTNDKTGACIFTDRVEKFIPPKKGKSHVLRMIRDLLSYTPKGKGTDPKKVLDFLNMTLNNRSIVFLITDAINLGDLTREFRMASSRHDFVVAAIRDPKEENIPDVGLLEVIDPETGEETILDTSSKAQVEHMTALRESLDSSFRRICMQTGIDTMYLTAGESIAKPLIRFFAQRQAKRFK
ncbi:MAG: DUF58 domain-containing protein [Candidatus Riflebacteria bacterium]|nr:DUF58 domain-containing protein [Candidatus Riflebacteria bacterium]